jgi:hypothetical protein
MVVQIIHTVIPKMDKFVEEFKSTMKILHLYKDLNEDDAMEGFVSFFFHVEREYWKERNAEDERFIEIQETLKNIGAKRCYILALHKIHDEKFH